MKTFANKQEKAAYYKERQIKENARRAAAEAADRYDTQGNPLGLDPALLSHIVTIEVVTLGGSFPSTTPLGEWLAANGQVSQRFWSDWRGSDAYGLMRGSMSFKAQLHSAGVSVKKLSDGRWTLTLHGRSVLN